MNWIDRILIVLFLILTFVLVGTVQNCTETIAAHKQRLAKAAICQPSGIEKRDLNRLFRKHGVQAAVEGKDGKLYFERNGQVCKFQ